MDLEKLIKPKSIAVVGVTDKPGFGRGAANGAMMSRIADHAYFVHPKREELFGKKCWPSISALPEAVDWRDTPWRSRSRRSLIGTTCAS